MQKNNKQHRKKTPQAGILNNGSLFRDMTGVEGTQKIALEGMLGNQQAAQKYAEMASSLANMGQQYALNKQAMKDGLLTKQQAAENTQDALKKHNQTQGERDAHDYNARMKAIDGSSASAENKQKAKDALTKNFANGGKSDEGMNPFKIDKLINHGGGEQAMVANPAIKKYKDLGYDVVDNGNGTMTVVPNSGNEGDGMFDKENEVFPWVNINITTKQSGQSGQSVTKEFNDYLVDILSAEQQENNLQCHQQISKLRRACYSNAFFEATLANVQYQALPQSINDNLRNYRYIKLKDGTICDIMHVFVGVEAGYYTKNLLEVLHAYSSATNLLDFIPGQILSEISNRDTATWLGDLASVLSEIYKTWVYDPMIYDKSTWQKYVDDYAGAIDLLADIDSRIIAESVMVLDPAKKISDILKDYYDTKFEVNQRKRSVNFANCVGLGTWDKNHKLFSNEKNWIEKFGKYIQVTAILFAYKDEVVQHNALLTGIGNIYFANILSFRAGKHLAMLFVESLKRQV